MRRIIVGLFLVLAVGCGGGQKSEEESRAEVFMKAESASGPSGARDIEQLEAWSGQTISVVGILSHLNFRHGIITTPAGLKIYLPHFDQIMEGDDWFKYLGKRCWVKGVLHTYTKNIEGYRGPSMLVQDFSGP